MKKVLFFVVALAVLPISLADTKVLHNVKIIGDHSDRTETFLLKNANTPEEELVIEGNHLQLIFPAHDPEHVYTIKTIYVADKDGYRVKYKLVLEHFKVPTAAYLNPTTLKSLG